MPIFARPLPAILSRIPASRYCDTDSPHYPRSTLSELIILSNSTPIPCPSFPVGLTHSPIRSRLTHSLAPRSPRATLLYLPATRSVSIGGQGARNLFVGRSWTAYGATPTQPDSQPKSISVALPTATQTPDTCFLCSLCPCPLLRLCAPL